MEAVNNDGGAVITAPIAPNKNEKLNEGVALVNRLIEIEQRVRAVEAERDQIKEEIIEYARTHGITSITGADKEAVIKSRTDVSIPSRHSDPEQYEKMLSVLKKSTHWAQLTDFSPAKLRQFINTTEGQTLRESLETMVQTQEQEYVILQKKGKPAIQTAKPGKGLNSDGSAKTEGGG